MIEGAISWIYDYVNIYLIDIVMFLLVGYVFIRSRSIGYVFSGVVILVLIFFTYVGGYAMPQKDIAIVLLLGTLVGGWRYLISANGMGTNFGFPFLSKGDSPNLSMMKRFDLFLAKRRFQKTYAEELAKEEARKDSEDRRGTKRSSGNGEEKTFSDNESASGNHEKRQKQRGEKFHRSRSENKPPNNEESDTRTPEEILGLFPGFTKEKLKQQYRKLSDKYHPDKNQHMSDNVRKEMENELTKVNLAYSELRKQSFGHS